MALATATTSSLKKSTFTFTGSIGNTGAKKFVLFAQYVVGNGSALTLSVSFIKNGISDSTTFKSSPANTATVAQQMFTVTGAMNVAIPVTVPAGASSIVIVAAGDGTTGTLVLDGYPDTNVS